MVKILSLMTSVELSLKIAENVKFSRIYQDLRQIDLASKAGMSYSSYKRFEQTGKISLTSLIDVLLVLNMVDDLKELIENKTFSPIEYVKNKKFKQRIKK